MKLEGSETMNSSKRIKKNIGGIGPKIGALLLLAALVAGCVSTEPYNIYTVPGGKLVVTRSELESEAMKQQGVTLVGWEELAAANRYVYVDKIPQGCNLAELAAHGDFERPRRLDACEFSAKATKVEPFKGGENRGSAN